MIHQEDEVKLKMKCEETRKELARKTRSLEDWYQKNKECLVPRDGMDPEIEGSFGREAVCVESLKLRLREEEAYQKQCRYVREKSLTSLKNHLPKLFRACQIFLTMLL
ncbi:kinesin-like protein, partial [Thalictrum thalictroides]